MASCLFCSFARLKPGDPGAYTMSLEQAWDKLRQRARISRSPKSTSSTACIPTCRSTTTPSCCAGFKRIRPDIHLKCFTAVEIAFFADLYGMTDEQVLRELMDAGLDSLPGGGAEIFAERVRKKICARQVRRRSLSRHSPHRAPARHALERDDALRAHRDGGRARRSHAARAGAAGRDRRVQAFIPLAFHPDNNQMRKLPAPSAADTLRVHAVVAADARQHSAREGVLDCDRRGGGADRAVVRRRRSRRHRAGREDLPHGRRPDAWSR